MNDQRAKDDAVTIRAWSKANDALQKENATLRQQLAEAKQLAVNWERAALMEQRQDHQQWSGGCHGPYPESIARANHAIARIDLRLAELEAHSAD